MLFECQKCKERFHHPAKQTHFFEPKNIEINEDTTIKVGDCLESDICPFCFSKKYAEYIEPTITEQPVNVLVIDLTTGPQLQVDRALADGYKIVNRYAKSYVLEKSAKPTVTQP
jgi:hypothetical protein